MYTIRDQCGQQIGGRSAWNGNSSSLSRPRLYNMSDQCGQWIGSTPRGMILVPLQVDHARVLSMISVVSELGALMVTWHELFVK